MTNSNILNNKNNFKNLTISNTNKSTLPIELWIKIITDSLPSPNFTDADDRHLILLSLSSVCSTFRLISQTLLFSHPTVDGNEALQLFTSSLKGRKNGNLEVKSLRLVRISRDQNGEIVKLFNYCDNLEEVFIWEACSSLAWFEYAQIKQLKSLHLYNTLIRNSNLPFHFPHLKNLSLQHLDAQLLPLNPTSLPQLNAVALHHIIFGGDSVPTFLARFKDQLIGLVLGDKLGGLQRFDWTLLTSLKILCLVPDVTRFGLRWANLNTRDFLFKFHPHLRVLHFPYLKETRFQPFSVQSPCLDRLHTLFFKLSPLSDFNKQERELANKEGDEVAVKFGIKVEEEKRNRIGESGMDSVFYPNFWKSVEMFKEGRFDLIDEDKVVEVDV